MVFAIHDYVSLSDAILLATILAVAYLGIRSQRPRILQEENRALAEENKRLREEKVDWTMQKSELQAQIKTLENRITVLEGKDTERLFDLLQAHDARVNTASEQVGEVLQGLAASIHRHQEQSEEVMGIILPIAREIQRGINFMEETPADGDES